MLTKNQWKKSISCSTDQIWTEIPRKQCEIQKKKRKTKGDLSCTVFHVFALLVNLFFWKFLLYTYNPQKGATVIMNEETDSKFLPANFHFQQHVNPSLVYRQPTPYSGKQRELSELPGTCWLLLGPTPSGTKRLGERFSNYWNQKFNAMGYC